MDTKIIVAALVMTIGASVAILLVYNVFMTGLSKYNPPPPKVNADTAAAAEAKDKADQLRQQQQLEKLRLDEQIQMDKLKAEEEKANRLLDKYKRF